MKNKLKYYYVAAAFIIWIVLYMSLQNIAAFIVYDSLKLAKNNLFTEALFFFVYEVPKVLLLLLLIVFITGIIRSYFSAEKTRAFLAGKPLFAGNIMASLLGIVTPFCSCSAIPLFLGFVQAGIPLGVTFSFLIASPVINEVALVLLFGLFGWQTALLYAGTGLVTAIFSGYIIGRLKVERFVEDWAYGIKAVNTDVTCCPVTADERIEAGIEAVKEIFLKVWLYIIIGIAVGAFIHGYVPENLMAGIMGRSAWWSVPVAILFGIPMYSNAAGIIPIVQALLEKGAALGTVLAFMMSVTGISLPEIIILRKVLKMPLIIIFICVVAVGIMIAGFLFNLIY